MSTSKDLNICFFNSIKSWGGGEKWHAEMAAYVAESEEKVYIYTSKGSALESKLAGSKVKLRHTSVSNLSYLNPFKVKALTQQFKKDAIDTIVINSSQDMKCAGLAAKKAGVKYIIYRRGSAIPIKNTFVNRYFFKEVVTDIIANSAATKETIVANNQGLFPREKMVVIPNGIDTDVFLKTLEKLPSHTSKKNLFTFGNLGRLVTQKNQLFLIEVAKKLKEASFPFQLIIGGEGKLLPELIAKTKEYNLENEIKFEGFVSHPQKFYQQLDVFVLSSLWEGFGYVIAEAMLCEKPVIAFDVSSNPELVSSNINGILTPVNDVDSVVEALQYFAENPKLIAQYGKAGKEKITKEFDASVARKRFLQYINTLQ